MSPPDRPHILHVAHFFAFRIKVDGRAYSGDWTLMQGGQICVRSAFGSLSDNLGNEAPQAVAERLLERIVRTHDERRVEETKRRPETMAALHRRRVAAEAQISDGGPDPAMEALRALVDQIERADFRDELGHPLTTNVAFIEAKQLVEGYSVAPP